MSRFGKHKKSNFKEDKLSTPKSDLYIRLRSGSIYAIVILSGSLLGNLATTIMLSIVSGICAYEFYFMLRSDAKLPNETLGIVASGMLPVSYYLWGFNGCFYVLISLLILLLLWYVFWLHSRIVDVSISLFGSMYCGGMLTCLLCLRMSIGRNELWGGIFVIFLLTTVSVNDGFAYLFGRKFGKHSLAPHISQKKSWEGFIAGLLCSTFVWLVLLWFDGINISLVQCLVFGVICGCAGVVGDLVESRIKRNSGVKDSGKIMPGHGGLLDRLDSIFLVSLTAYLLLVSNNCIL